MCNGVRIDLLQIPQGSNQFIELCLFFVRNGVQFCSNFCPAVESSRSPGSTINIQLLSMLMKFRKKNSIQVYLMTSNSIRCRPVAPLVRTRRRESPHPMILSELTKNLILKTDAPDGQLQEGPGVYRKKNRGPTRRRL